MIRSIAGSIARPLAVAITGASGVVVSNTLQALRNLDTSNGGAFDVSILDATSRAYSDTAATTLATDGDSVAAIRDNLTGADDETIVALQTTPGFQATYTTDALGTGVASTDGGDDLYDLPDGWITDGTNAFAISLMLAPNDANSENFARLFGSTGTGTDAWLEAGVITFRVADGGSASTAQFSFDRVIRDNEPVLMTFTWAPGEAPRIRWNGRQVAEGSSAYTTLDATSGDGLMGRSGSNNSLAATLWGAGKLTGATAPTDAQVRILETHLASLAGITLAPQTRAEALTAFRRPKTPATDLNVSDSFDYADTAALLEVWTDQSTGDCSVTQDAANGWAVLAQGASGQCIFRRVFPARVGYRYTVTALLDATSAAGTVSFQVGTESSGSKYGTVNPMVAGTVASVTFEAEDPFIVVRFDGFGANRERYLTAVTFDEIARVGTGFDLLDETRFLNDDGTQVALGGSIPNVLPSVADGDARVGPELWGEPTTASIVGAINTGVSDSGILTLNRYYRATASIDTLTSGGVYIGSGAAISDAVTSGDSITFYFIAVNTDLAFRASENGTDLSLSGISVKEVLYNPLRQTTPGEQPTRQTAGASFDGGDDNLVAVDPDGDLAITGDVTIIATLTPSTVSGGGVIVGSGDDASSTADVAFLLYRSGTNLTLRQADASASEEEVATSVFALDQQTTLSVVREGADVVFGADGVITNATFSTVTAPTAGSSPKTILGENLTGGTAFAGSKQALAIFGGAIPPGQLVVLEAAAELLAEGG